MLKNKAFTLAELLITLLIIGVIAVITLPTLMSNIANKTMTTQIKNLTVTIQQLASDQMLSNKTRYLSLTDFGDPNKLLTPENFAMTKSCEGSKTSNNSCWDNGYTTINGDDKSIPLGPKSIALKNGVVLSYLVVDDGTRYGYFIADVNGKDGPNIIGRDVFGFYITDNGQISVHGGDHKTSCKAGNPYYCFCTLMSNNWVMDY